MKSIGKALLFAFLSWLIAFAAAFAVYPLKESNPPFFETIMPIVLSLCAVVFSILYFKKIDSAFMKEGIYLGLIFFLLNIGIDLLLFMWGPMKMTFAAYMTDIGLTYLIYPIFSIGYGYTLDRRR